jgi:hypothetical protein
VEEEVGQCQRSLGVDVRGKDKTKEGLRGERCKGVTHARELETEVEGSTGKSEGRQTDRSKSALTLQMEGGMMGRGMHRQRDK